MNNKYFVPAYLCVVLVVSNCTVSRSQVNEKALSTPVGITSQANSLATASIPKPEPRELMDAVKRAYSGLTYYQTRGVHKERDEFNGKTTETEIPFEIEYSRGQRSEIKWTYANNDNVLKIVGKESWLEVNGKRDRTFSNPGEALGIAPLLKGGDFLFGIKFFVFSEEMGQKDKFFMGLAELENKGEETVDGHACHVLTGMFRGVEVRDTFWIDKEKSIIRRIENITVVRKTSEGKEYVGTSTETENYTDIISRTGQGDSRD